MSAADLKIQIQRALEGRRDLRLVLLFGSEARGTARESSDVDVAVDAPGVDLLDLGAVLMRALDREVDVVSLEDPGVPLLSALVRDGVVLYEGRPGAFAMWRSHALLTLETDRPWYDRMSKAWLSRVAERGFSRG